MPKLVLLAACEKAIVDQATNAVSLMSLLQNINIQAPPAGLPTNTMIPMRWNIVSIFQRLSEEIGKTFEQRSEFVDGSGQLKLETPVAVFEFKAEFHRVFNQVAAMPVGSAGICQVKCLLREKGAASWVEMATYPIRVNWMSTVKPTVH